MSSPSSLKRTSSSSEEIVEKKKMKLDDLVTVELKYVVKDKINPNERYSLRYFPEDSSVKVIIPEYSEEFTVKEVADMMNSVDYEDFARNCIVDKEIKNVEVIQEFSDDDYPNVAERFHCPGDLKRTYLTLHYTADDGSENEDDKYSYTHYSLSEEQAMDNTYVQLLYEVCSHVNKSNPGNVTLSINRMTDDTVLKLSQFADTGEHEVLGPQTLYTKEEMKKIIACKHCKKNYFAGFYRFNDDMRLGTEFLECICEKSTKIMTRKEHYRRQNEGLLGFLTPSMRNSLIW